MIEKRCRNISHMTDQRGATGGPATRNDTHKFSISNITKKTLTFQISRYYKKGPMDLQLFNLILNVSLVSQYFQQKKTLSSLFFSFYSFVLIFRANKHA